MTVYSSVLEHYQGPVIYQYVVVKNRPDCIKCIKRTNLVTSIWTIVHVRAVIVHSI